MIARKVPDKICVFCKSSFNRNRSKNGRLESIYVFLRRKYCCRFCYDESREHKDFGIYPSCLYCGEEIPVYRHKNRQYIQNRAFCNRKHFFLFWKDPKNKGKRLWFQSKGK